MHWKTVSRKNELIEIDVMEGIEGYCKWLFSQPIKRTLAGRNDRGRNIMYLHGTYAGGVRRKRQIVAMYKKGWYAHEYKMD